MSRLRLTGAASLFAAWDALQPQRRDRRRRVVHHCDLRLHEHRLRVNHRFIAAVQRRVQRGPERQQRSVALRRVAALADALAQEGIDLLLVRKRRIQRGSLPGR